MKNSLIFFSFFLSINCLTFYSLAEPGNEEILRQTMKKYSTMSKEEIDRDVDQKIDQYLENFSKRYEMDQVEYNPLNYTYNNKETAKIMDKEIRSIRFKPYTEITDPYLIVLKLGKEYYLENHRYCDEFKTFAREKKIVNQQPFVKACLFHNHLRMLRRIGTINESRVRYPSRQWFDDFFAYMLIEPAPFH